MVQVPPAQTYCFQPADQFIIRTVKHQARVKFDTSLAELFRDNEVADAVKLMTSTSAPILRARKVRFIVESAVNLSYAVIYESWWVTGIMRERWKHQHHREVLYDAYKDLAKLEEYDEQTTDVVAVNGEHEKALDAQVEQDTPPTGAALAPIRPPAKNPDARRKGRPPKPKPGKTAPAPPSQGPLAAWLKPKIA